MSKEAKKFLNQGNAHFEVGEFDRAIQNYKQAIKLNPKFTEAFKYKEIIIPLAALTKNSGVDCEWTH